MGPLRKNLERWLDPVSQIALAICGLAENGLIGAFQEAWVCENLVLKPQRFSCLAGFIYRDTRWVLQNSLTEIKQKPNASWTATKEKWRSMQDGSIQRMRGYTAIPAWRTRGSIWSVLTLKMYMTISVRKGSINERWCVSLLSTWYLFTIPPNSDQYREHSMSHYQELLICWWPRRNISQCNLCS